MTQDALCPDNDHKLFTWKLQITVTALKYDKYTFYGQFRAFMARKE